MTISNIAKVVLGFAIAIALLIGGSIAATLYLVAKLTALPPKPVFDSTPPTGEKTAATPAATPTATPTATPSPTPTPTPSGYLARVTWQEGLLLRTSPDFNAASDGGIGFNQEVRVLEETGDGKWQRVRLESGKEGWVVGGNTNKVEE
ncbi:MAG: SH3 domain-containing protein [Geitlerinemataceae cyanobacterium]